MGSNTISCTIDGKPVTAGIRMTILKAAREVDVTIPTLCHLDGLADIGTCRICVVEIEGMRNLVPSCKTPVGEGMVIYTQSERVVRYRRMVLELLFAQGHHVCAICVANNHCELQNMAIESGMDHTPYMNRFPGAGVDLSHPEFGRDPNRCILCARCVRVCKDIEGAHVWDIARRGTESHLVAGLNQPWGTVQACTSCGKCVESCPTGALFRKGTASAEKVADNGIADFLSTAREQNEWKR